MTKTTTLIHLRLFLNDLFSKREADLLLSVAGQYYAPQLRERRTAIGGLPPALTQGTPFADELSAADKNHDGFGAAMYHSTEVVFRLPDAPAELVAAAVRIRLAFIPELKELLDSYAEEADRAIEREPKLEELAADLRLFPVPDNRTLYDVATSFLAAGRNIHDLLSRRADVPKGARARAAAIRSETVGVINRLRADLGREIKKNPALPRDLDQRVFGYLDTLLSMKPTEAAATEPAPEEPTPVTP